MKVLVLVLLLSVCSSLALPWQTDTDTDADADAAGAGSGRPYHYGEESFQDWTRSPQGRFRVLERFTDELIEGAVGNYRVAELDAAPRAFVQPKYYDADEVMFVKGGEGVVVLLYGGRRESFCVREGDVVVVPAGTVVYSANTHPSESFRVVKLLIPVVSASGRLEEFFPIGRDPESFLGVFSDGVIRAAFNTTSRELWEQLFEKQSEGQITAASEEQILELSRSCSRSPGSRSSHERGDSLGSRSSSSSDWAITPLSLTGMTPTYSNSHGSLYEINGDESPDLQQLGLEVSLANISVGSMIAPSYNNRGSNIAIVVAGRGYFELAVTAGGPSSQRREVRHGREEEEEHNKSRSYRQVRSRISESSVIVIPAGNPIALVDDDEDKNLAVLFFEVNANSDEKVFLAGTNSALQLMDGTAKLLAFAAVDEEQVDLVIGAQTDAVFLRAPQSRRISSA